MDSTRERILSVAIASFSSRGYNAVGVQEICDAALITKPSLYYHFGSKRGLLDAIAEERYGAFVRRVENAVAYRGDVAGSLTLTLRVFLADARADADFSRLRLSLAFSPPSSEEHEAFRPHTEALYASVRAFFVSASRDHGNMRGRDQSYAASYIGTADAYVGLSLAGALDPDDGFVRGVVHHFMHGIFS